MKIIGDCPLKSPKYTISLANKCANGKELNPSEFSGGKETNDYLRTSGGKGDRFIISLGA
jgi:hypothetical protein